MSRRTWLDERAVEHVNVSGSYLHNDLVFRAAGQRTSQQRRRDRQHVYLRDTADWWPRHTQWYTDKRRRGRWRRIT